MEESKDGETIDERSDSQEEGSSNDECVDEEDPETSVKYLHLFSTKYFLCDHAQLHIYTMERTSPPRETNLTSIDVEMICNKKRKLTLNELESRDTTRGDTSKRSRLHEDGNDESIEVATQTLSIENFKHCVEAATQTDTHIDDKDVI